MKKNFFNALLAGAIAFMPVYSFGMNETSPDKSYASLEDIPLPLMKNLQSGFLTREQYIANVLSTIRREGRTKFSIDQQDIDTLNKKNSKEQRRQILSQFVSYDYDFDGVVTREDIVSILSARNSSVTPVPPPINEQDVTRIWTPFLSYDANNDGKVTYEEARTVASQASKTPDLDNRRSTKGLVELLSLDPNGDGQLTADELEILAKKVFHTIDKDGDGILSGSETQPLVAIQRKLSELNRITGVISSECKSVTQMAKDEKVVSLAVYEGETISSVSVAGQSKETNIVSVYIAPGKEKIYLLASSYEPIIWKISGATDRISHAVLAGPSIRDNTQNNDTELGKVNVGIIGLPAKDVEFRYNGLCGLESSFDKQFSEAADVVIKRLVGKKADVILSQYRALDIQIGPEGQVTQSEANTSTIQRLDNSPVPKGFDPITWRRSLISSSGGVSFEKANTVVSEAKVQDYIVLPSWAGISKLVHDGVLVPLNNTPPMPGMPVSKPSRKATSFKIVKEMPYYPAGLYGGLSTTFILGKGINPPKGDIGHSCLIAEDGSRAIAGIRSSRCAEN